MRVRLAEPKDTVSIAAIYNQGIEERSSTFETAPRSLADMLDRINAMERYPVLVMDSVVIAAVPVTTVLRIFPSTWIAVFVARGSASSYFSHCWRKQKLADSGKSFHAFLPSITPVSPCAKPAVSAKWGYMKNTPAWKDAGSTA